MPRLSALERARRTRMVNGLLSYAQREHPEFLKNNAAWAKEAKVPRSTVSKVVRRERLPEDKTLGKLAKALSVELSELEEHAAAGELAQFNDAPHLLPSMMVPESVDGLLLSWASSFLRVATDELGIEHPGHSVRVTQLTLPRPFAALRSNLRNGSQFEVLAEHHPFEKSPFTYTTVQAAREEAEAARSAGSSATVLQLHGWQMVPQRETFLLVERKGADWWLEAEQDDDSIKRRNAPSLMHHLCRGWKSENASSAAKDAARVLIERVRDSQFLMDSAIAMRRTVDLLHETLACSEDRPDESNEDTGEVTTRERRRAIQRTLNVSFVMVPNISTPLQLLSAGALVGKTIIAASQNHTWAIARRNPDLNVIISDLVDEEWTLPEAYEPDWLRLSGGHLERSIFVREGELTPAEQSLAARWFVVLGTKLRAVWTARFDDMSAFIRPALRATGDPGVDVSDSAFFDCISDRLFLDIRVEPEKARFAPILLSSPRTDIRGVGE